jgi:3-methylcrotonyl-CoA carboxylase alpha subunit
MFRKVLVANRGEIAVRVQRACHELGIKTVAVYSEADRNSLHVRIADNAVFIGSAPVKESYLVAERLIEATLESGADALHPGYGLLSENADFAEAVQAAGVVFIGPTPQAIRLMGDKSAARGLMQAVGVPIVPGYQGETGGQALRQAAERIGFPILIKAAAGGGGKGMRVAHSLSDFNELLQAARREAEHAFGDGRILLEKYIPSAHHVEFQILADEYGNILHLFERDCSVQRRHQKIIEESPSPLVDTDLRTRMGEAAIIVAQSVGYTNAGTVEFIVDSNQKDFYFLEMNTRLQVEHPVTEMITGVDLVQWQIRLAAGERLPYHQSDLVQRGHAIECRVYAEDPERSFLPASGRLLKFYEPQGPGVRIDSGVMSGDEISVHYDPLIAKVIVYAENRDAAIRKMRSCLREMVVLGITTNLHFLEDVLGHPDFKRGSVDTTWVERHFVDWQVRKCGVDPEILIALAMIEADLNVLTLQADGIDHPHNFPWNQGDGFRLGQAS